MIDFNMGVSLCPISDCNLELLREWRNNPKIWAWTRQNDLLNLIPHVNWFEKIQTDPKIKMYGVKNESGSLVGVCGLTDLDWHNRRAEFSLYIAPPHQGKGLGEKALKTLCEHGFVNFGLNVIWGETFSENPAFNMFTKIGMRHEGTRKEFYWKNGKFIDAYIIALTAQEWSDRKSPVL